MHSSGGSYGSSWTREAVKDQGRNRGPSAEDIRHEMDALIRSDGPWTAHNIDLAPGVQTMGCAIEDLRLRRVLQIAADLAGKPLSELRVLDLGCLEGQFGLEFALHGSEVIAVEGREANLRKSRFAAKALGASNMDLRYADVRDLTVDDYGKFDVILCLGILYHLDGEDAVQFIHSLANLCRGMLIIDTHISLNPQASIEWNGDRYHGDFWTEYESGEREAEETEALWSSIGNDRSFLFTRASLCNLLRHAGFTSVYECLNPYECHSPEWPHPPSDGAWLEWPDRMTFIAMKGQRVKLFTSAATDDSPEHERPETPRYLDPILPARAGMVARLRRKVARTLMSKSTRRL